MLKKIITSVLIPAFLTQVIGCYSMNLVSKENLNKERDAEIRVYTNDNKYYEGESNNWFFKNDSLIINNNSDQQNIPLNSIEEIYADQFDTGKTVILVGCLLLIPVLLGFILKDSGAFRPF